MKTDNKRDKVYIETVLSPIRVCASYKPKLGQGGKTGCSLSDFQKVYRSDPFYSWFGLDNPLMYAAHKAAGGMTSIYRQIGIGSEALFRKILQDELGLTEEQSKWSYAVLGVNKKNRRLSLDGRIPLSAIQDHSKRDRTAQWMTTVCNNLDIERSISKSLKGVVFEVRQGYKSKDSKRQNADIANAATAYTQAYLPCAIIMSNQIDSDILHRYRTEKWVILTGDIRSDSPFSSTYSFMKQVIGYDLAAFFNRNARQLRNEVATVLEALLRAE
ncbi:MAG TPA: hypothetical protein ENN97_10820 [Phycisphaerales bacterium]|nr:hypothetical protein [Phycisphaerales bacterium]